MKTLYSDKTSPEHVFVPTCLGLNCIRTYGQRSKKFTDENTETELCRFWPNQNWTLPKSILSNVIFTEIDFIERDLYRNQFHRRRSLPKSILLNVNFTEIDFIENDLWKKNFTENDLSKTIFTKINFIEDGLYWNRFYRTISSNANFTEIDFIELELYQRQKSKLSIGHLRWTFSIPVNEPSELPTGLHSFQMTKHLGDLPAKVPPKFSELGVSYWNSSPCVFTYWRDLC